MVFVFITLMVLALVAAAALGSPNETSVNLGPSETRSFHPSQFWRNGIEVQDSSGIIQTHFFDSRPTLLTTTVFRQESDQRNIAGENYYFWGFYLNKGSTIDLNWSSNSELELWIVEGNSDFKSWENGENKGTPFLPSTSSSIDFVARSSNDYYFIFYNLAFSTSSTVSVSFGVNFRVHDISNSQRSISGTFSESGVDEDYIVLYNPTIDDDITVQYSEKARFSFGIIILVEIVVVVGIIFLINRYRKKQKAKAPKAPQTSAEYQSQFYDASGKPTQTTQSQYNQRPKAKFCTACGSGVLSDAEFCTECGTKTK